MAAVAVAGSANAGFDTNSTAGLLVNATRSGDNMSIRGFGNTGSPVSAVPAPGAIALLGAAGFVGSRRRRA
ncbi:MAG: PEP-CTERM sorting domain-containing protein [Planctomycetota bacterium]